MPKPQLSSTRTGVFVSDKAEFETRFRPLLSSTVGTGVVALGMLDFAASEWSGFGADSRALISMAARTAYLGFLMSAVVLVCTYLFSRMTGPILTTLVNVYGVGVFLVGTFTTGSLISEALDLAIPGGAEPPDSVASFIGFAGLGLLGLGLTLAAAVTHSLVRKLPKLTRKTEDAAQ